MEGGTPRATQDGHATAAGRQEQVRRMEGSAGGGKGAEEGRTLFHFTNSSLEEGSDLTAIDR